MSDDIKKYRAILEGSHAQARKKSSLTEGTQPAAKMLLESMAGKKITTNQLFEAMINHPQIRGGDAALRVLKEMKAQLKKKV